MKFSCIHLSECSGCNPLAIDLKSQHELKLENFKRQAREHDILQSTTEVVLHDLGEGFLRTRFELSWQNGHWGFWSKDRHELVDIRECHQIDPALNVFYQKFRKISWPLQKASVRLRLGPKNNFGVWLDLANTDVRDLFVEKSQLLQCLDMGEVEIGQRRKKLNYDGERFRLSDPEFKEWISTYVSGIEKPLFSLIGGFSQSGPKATQVICETYERLLKKVNATCILEFGSGFGTLTLPGAALAKNVIALEVDERSIEGLKMSLHRNRIENVEILRGDFQKKAISPEKLKDVDTFVVNPPRSGVQNLLLAVPAHVKNLIYMSCFEESFFKDSQKLKEQSFIMTDAHLIDQFPQTPHTEWMSLWSRS